MGEIRLGVNVDHVATIRQQRGTRYSDPAHAAMVAEQAGADQITIHLREDRRHIQERDVAVISQTVQTLLNLEMAATVEMMGMVRKYRPKTVTLVPEKREERTTEGGLDVVGRAESLRPYIAQLRELGAKVSLFIEPAEAQILMSKELGAQAVELHTGHYADATSDVEQRKELDKLIVAGELAHEAGLEVIAGHGLDYHNIKGMLEVPYLEEVNIGHAIIARAIFSGLDAAIRDMVALLIG